MGPKSRVDAAEQDLFRMELVNLIDRRHELVKLAGLIDWSAFAKAWGPKFESTTGRPAVDTRLMASLLYLKHTFALSDEDVVERWKENPYWQHFSGERYFQHELPCDPSSPVRWRQRIGEDGCEWQLEHSIKAALSAGVMKRPSQATVIVDTTVQPKAIAHPTDSRLLNRAREQLVAGEITGTLKTRVETAQRLHEQRRDSKHKLYALHAPEVECIAKGKARTPYEFGVKTSVAVTAKEGVVVGMRSMPGAPYDGHTLHSQLEQVEILTGVKPSMALADRGYRGVPPPEGTRLLISHTRGLPPVLKKLLKRRQAIEPTIGHMKTDGLLARNWLKGSESDAIHAVLCGAGHNLRLILAHLRVLLLALIVLMTGYARNALTAAWQTLTMALGAAVRLPAPVGSS